MRLLRPRHSWLSLVSELIALIALVVLALYTTHSDEEERFADSIAVRRHEFPAGKPIVYAVEETPVETFAFDPNTADSTQLLRLGLAPWQVQAIYRYRAKRGRYHTPEDFARTPGMTNEMWQRLGPCVEIAPQFRYVDLPPQKSKPRKSQPQASQTAGEAQHTVHPATMEDNAVKADTFPTRREKFREPTLVDINTADTNVLMKIPGIGSVRARAIVEYRRKLGGYVRVEQAMEAYRMPDEVMEWFALECDTVQLLAINRLSVGRLMQHPYITFYQARAIVEHRTKHGPLRESHDLLRLDEFGLEDVERLKPYLSFEVE